MNSTLPHIHDRYPLASSHTLLFYTNLSLKKSPGGSEVTTICIASIYVNAQ